MSFADPSGRAVEVAGSQSLGSWDCGFNSLQGQISLSLVSDVCWQVDVSASGRSFVQRSPIDCGVSECDREASTMRRS
jgi:hypothetical protein